MLTRVPKAYPQEQIHQHFTNPVFDGVLLSSVAADWSDRASKIRASFLLATSCAVDFQVKVLRSINAATPPPPPPPLQTNPKTVTKKMTIHRRITGFRIVNRLMRAAPAKTIPSVRVPNCSV